MFQVRPGGLLPILFPLPLSSASQYHEKPPSAAASLANSHHSTVAKKVQKLLGSVLPLALFKERFHHSMSLSPLTNNSLARTLKRWGGRMAVQILTDPSNWLSPYPTSQTSSFSHGGLKLDCAGYKKSAKPREMGCRRKQLLFAK